ncbi:MAG: GNAT family N-acetyltransferase [Bacteroidales bacterium]|nr:GNAT family N-acetyltransferase [Bacteroidales bacterium]
MMIITDPNKIDKKKWSDFVYNHPHGNIFQTPEMYDVYFNTEKYFPIIVACVDDNQNILGVLISVIQKEYAGILGYFSSRSIVFGGPLVMENNVEITNRLIIEYDSIVTNRVIYSQFRNFYIQDQEIKIFDKNKFKYEEHLNILIDLKLGEEKLWNNFSRSRKKGIRKALKEQFEFELSNNRDQIEGFYHLLSVSYNKTKLPFPSKDFFYNIFDNCNNSNYKFFTLKYEGEIIVFLFALVYKKTFYTFYLGTVNDENIIKKKPLDLFFWEVIKWSVKNKLYYFDWMGAGKPNKPYGVRDFKLQFGGELLNFGRYEKHHSFLGYKISSIGFKIWVKAKNYIYH